MPNAVERELRRMIVREVQDIAREALPEHEIEIFGSERTGLATLTSDLDLRLCPPEDKVDIESWKQNQAPRMAARKANVRALRKLKSFFEKSKKGYVLCNLRNARYPLLSVHHSPSGTDIQIVCSNDTSRSREVTLQYSTYNIARAIFQARGMLDVFHGGLGSYTLFMMVVASYKIRLNEEKGWEPVYDDRGTGDCSLANPFQAVLNFLDFWTRFDTYKHAISLEPVYCFSKHTGQAQPSLLMSLPDADNEVSSYKSPSVQEITKAKFHSGPTSLAASWPHKSAAAVFVKSAGPS